MGKGRACALLPACITNAKVRHDVFQDEKGQIELTKQDAQMAKLFKK